jgi:peroxiredoxin Q/BCP
LQEKFEGRDTVVLGVSLDSAASHRNFRKRDCLPFDILLDPELDLCRSFDVKVTNLLVVRLAARVTYLIGKDGRILEAFDHVDPRDHASEVLSRLG